MREDENISLILPSIKNSGGTILALDLINFITKALNFDQNIVAYFNSYAPVNSNTEVTTLCKKKINRSNAIFIFLTFFPKIMIWAIRLRKTRGKVICTHWTTFIVLAFLQRHRRIIFFQDREDLFERNPLLRMGIRLWSNFWLRHSDVITTSVELSSLLPNKKNLIGIYGPMPEIPKSKDNKKLYDGVFIYKYGSHKEAQKYVSLVNQNAQHRFLCISTELNVYNDFKRNSNVDILNNLSHQKALKAISEAKIFVCLSSHEGFGMPGLEALGFGLPVLMTHNFGSYAYIKHSKEQRFLSEDEIIDNFEEHLKDCSKGKTLDSYKTFTSYIRSAERDRMDLLTRLQENINSV